MKSAIRGVSAAAIVSILALIGGNFLTYGKVNIDIETISAAQFDSAMRMYYIGLKVVAAAGIVLLVSAEIGIILGVICTIKHFKH